MKREIKFRAWNSETKKMMLWSDIKRFGNLNKLISLSFVHVMEFIFSYGNVDIYEGDLVKGKYMIQRSLNPDAEPEIIYFDGVITYSTGCFYVKSDNGQCAFSFSYPDFEIEVIGNIYEQ